MDTKTYMLEMFKDTQNAIRFLEQKVSFMLVFICLEITAVLEVTKNYVLIFNNCNTKNVILLIFIILFFALIAVCLFIAFIIMLKPEKPHELTSIRDKFTNRIIKEEEIETELSKALFSRSGARIKMLEHYRILITMTFLSFFLMLTVVFVNKVL